MKKIVAQKNLSDCHSNPPLFKEPCVFTHGYDFDPTCGMNLAQLLDIVPPEPPADFTTFWERRYAAALTVSPHSCIQASGCMLKGHVVHDLRYLSTGGVEISGWLLIPEDGKVSRGLIIGHGYNGREAPDEPLAVDEAALLFPCFRGLGRSPLANVSPEPYQHVLHDIQNRERYILGGCVEDLWLAVAALLELFPEVAGRIGYSGISFGGGIGALAAPWDSRIQRLHLQIPTFGHHALRLTLPCVGSGESVRIFQRQHDFNIMETLAYYDAASAARYLRIPTLVAAARFDPAVPPSGQFAIYNAIPEKLRHLFVLDAGHFDYPCQEQQMQEMNRELACFFMEQL
ncbi:MAG: acetylxylan esterase [Gallionella sp.]|nr:acetylxylan esterase [Gallionella sp.]